jgi:hypothetical protein
VARVELKLRVTARNPAHVRAVVFDRLDGEGDVPDRGWRRCGELTFDAGDWDRELSVRFEAMGAEVEEAAR